MNKKALLQELETLPEDKVKEVSDFIRCLKSKESAKKRWDLLCAWGKNFAKEKRLKEKDIGMEITKSRYNAAS